LIDIVTTALPQTTMMRRKSAAGWLLLAALGWQLTGFVPGRKLLNEMAMDRYLQRHLLPG
jgi:hypothetical protein